MVLVVEDGQDEQVVVGHGPGDLSEVGVGVDVDGVRLHRAPGSGDDELVRVADADHLVVTADRGLRARLEPEVLVTGPSTVLGWLEEPGRVR